MPAHTLAAPDMREAGAAWARTGTLGEGTMLGVLAY
jgi:hypothetical protein